MTSLPSPSLGRALYNTMAFDPRKVLEEPNFATREQNHIILFSVCCWHSILHVYEILLSEMKFLQKLGCSKTFRGSNAIVLYSARPSEGDGSDVITVCFRGSYLVNQAKFSSAVIATTIFTAQASHTQNKIFDHTLPLIAALATRQYALYQGDSASSCQNWGQHNSNGAKL